MKRISCGYTLDIDESGSIIAIKDDEVIDLLKDGVCGIFPSLSEDERAEFEACVFELIKEDRGPRCLVTS